MDTLVDPVETLPSLPSSTRTPAAKPAEPAQRGSLPSLDPDAQVQWFSRVFVEEPPPSIDVEVYWDEECDTEPTLVLRKRAH